jgi:hypothetical protein
VDIEKGVEEFVMSKHVKEQTALELIRPSTTTPLALTVDCDFEDCQSKIVMLRTSGSFALEKR